MTPVLRLLAALALAVGSLVVAGATGTPAYACSCVPFDVAQSVERAEAVFTGTVRERSQAGELEPVVYTVAVDQVYKGRVAAETTVATAAHEAACGLPRLPEGEQLLFFGSGTTLLDRGQGAVSSDLAVNLCGGTGPADDHRLAGVAQVAGAPSEPAGAALGDGVTDDTPDASAGSSDPTDGGVSPWLVGGLGVGALVLAVLAGVVLRRRSS